MYRRKAGTSSRRGCRCESTSPPMITCFRSQRARRATGAEKIMHCRLSHTSHALATGKKSLDSKIPLHHPGLHIAQLAGHISPVIYNEKRSIPSSQKFIGDAHTRATPCASLISWCQTPLLVLIQILWPPSPTHRGSPSDEYV